MEDIKDSFKIGITKILKVENSDNNIIIDFINEDNENCKASINKETLITLMNNNKIEYLKRELKINNDLSDVHPNFNNTPSDCLLNYSDNTINFKNSDNLITLSNPWDNKKNRISKYINFRNNNEKTKLGKITSDKNLINILKESFINSIPSIWKNDYNITFNQTNNIIFINKEDEDKNRRTDYDLIKDLITRKPYLSTHFKKVTNNDIMYCDKGIWRDIMSSEIKNIIIFVILMVSIIYILYFYLILMIIFL